jgi:S-adenosylmethionine-diacylglycerol 3-amino-3-carboxypropyl transferase
MAVTDEKRGGVGGVAAIGASVGGKRIEERARFDAIRYANCWEDADVLVTALRPGPGMRILSIASAGDNALALAAEGATVVAADLSAAQLACCELRIAAIRTLDHPDVLAFLGVRESEPAHRLAVYAKLLPLLTAESAAFWNARPAIVSTGVIHAGKFEHYFRTFRTRLLPLIHSRRRIAQLMTPRDEPARHAFYNNTWNNLRWRCLFRVFFSRFVMGRMGRDPEFFRYVSGSVADRILTRARYALTTLPTHDNPYLTFILTGNYGRALPRYLRPEHFSNVRAGLDRLTLHRGSIETVAAGAIAAAPESSAGFDAFNLSDIFEYIDESASIDIYARLIALARPGARLAYWNTLVPRSCPPSLRDRVTPLTDFAAELLAADRAFFYCAFHVDEVR